jgi:hypothetical protein
MVRFTNVLCMYKHYMGLYNINYFSATMVQVSFKSMSTCNFANVFLSPAPYPFP